MNRYATAVFSAVIATAAILTASCGGGTSDADKTTDGASSQSPATPAATIAGSDRDDGDPRGAALTVEAYLEVYCGAYAAWESRVYPSDGIDPRTLELEARLERANRLVRDAAEASRDFLDVLYELNPPPALSAINDLSIDRVKFLMWDMEDYVDEPAGSLDDLEGLAITFEVRTEVLTNTLENEAAKLSPTDANEYLFALDANPACASLPR